MMYTVVIETLCNLYAVSLKLLNFILKYLHVTLISFVSSIMVNANWVFYEVGGYCQALFDLAFDPQVLFSNHRQEKAQLLGFQNFAQLSLDSKMAGNPSEVWKMITDLHSKSKEAAESELQALQVNQIISLC